MPPSGKPTKESGLASFERKQLPQFIRHTRLIPALWLDLLNDRSAHPALPPPHPPLSSGAVLTAALKLGLTSFGGPIAHLGYFERTYVRERRWLNAQEYAGLVALCQFLPGPTSSQVGVLIGLRAAGWRGAVAAWVGFTFPSALLMFGFGLLLPRSHSALMQAGLHGLMLAAVSIVAQAVWNMARSLCPDRNRAAIGLLAAAALLFEGGGLVQLIVLGLGAVGGVLLCRELPAPSRQDFPKTGARLAWVLLAIFAALLIALPVAARLFSNELLSLTNIFYRAGALVFGGGHVVLPLLHEALVPQGAVPEEMFLAGYGFAQAMPGPLFSFAAFLGAASAGDHEPLIGATFALAAIFLPGILLAVSAYSMWTRIASVGWARSALAGTNAAVVGLLGAALYNPVWTNAVRDTIDVVAVVLGGLLLMHWRTPPIIVVGLLVALSIGRRLF